MSRQCKERHLCDVRPLVRCECMLSASRVCKCFVHDCKRLAELSASGCNRRWKALCCNARKKDLASCADLLSYAEKGSEALCM
jgi:hypothetical protein